MRQVSGIGGDYEHRLGGSFDLLDFLVIADAVKSDPPALFASIIGQTGLPQRQRQARRKDKSPG